MQQKQTLANIFAKPTLADIRYSSIESLIKALGGTVDEKRSGSRVALTVRDSPLVVHRPHPSPDMPKYSVEDIRDWLESLDIRPEED